MNYAKAWTVDLELAYADGDLEAGAEIRRRREQVKSEMEALAAADREAGREAGTVTGLAPRGYADWGGDGNEDGSE